MRTTFGSLLPIFAKLFPARRLRSSRRQKRSRFQSRLFLESLEERRLLVSNLSVTKFDAPDPAVPGGTLTYTIQVNNAGPDTATATIADTFPAGFTGAVFTSSATGGASGNTTSGGGNINNNVVMPAGSSITYTVTGTVSPTATGSLTNTVTVTPTGATTDPNANNNTDTETTSLTPQADLAITKTNGQVTVASPGTTNYVIVVSNSGPSSVTGATIADDFPTTLTNVTFTATGTGGASGFANGTGDLTQTVNLPAGSTITYNVTANVAAGATGTISNTATVTAPTGVTEITTANNTSTDIDTVGATATTADLGITKTNGVSAVTPGGTVTYVIVVSNTGPSPVTGATVTDVFPPTLTGVTFTSTATGGATGNTPTGTGNLTQTVNLPVGSTITYTVTGTVSPTAAGAIANSAQVTAPAGVADANAANNVAIDIDTVAPVVPAPVTADLSVTKTNGVSSVAAGSTTTYIIVVRNNGPSPVVGATVTDVFPPTLTGVAFTATGTGGASGFANGSGNINQTVNLPVGSTITYTVTGTVSPNATGAIANTAVVTTPPGVADINPANNVGVDVDTIAPNVPPAVDLTIDKSNTVTTVAPGGTLTYTILVSNPGATPVTGATVTDVFPPTLTNVTFTTTSTNGATSTPSTGSGNINATVNLPAASSITYTVTGTVSPNAAGVISNTATVTTPVGVADSNPANNVDTETDVVITPLTADLSVTKTDNVATVQAGGTLTYVIVVSNAGPSAANGARVIDVFPPTLQNVSFTASGTGGASGFSSGSGNINQAVNLPAGATITYIVTGQVSPAATGTVTNTVIVAPPPTVGDPDSLDNIATDTTTIVPQDVEALTDVSVTKEDGPGPVVSGDLITYTITVSNNTTVAASNVTLTDAIPAGTSFVSFTPDVPGWTITRPAPGATSGAVVATTSSLAADPSVTFQLVVQVEDTAVGAITNTATVTTTTAETTLANNVDTVTTVVEDEEEPPPVELVCIVETFNTPGNPGSVFLTEDLDSVEGGTALIITGTSRKDVIVVVPHGRDRIRVLMNGRNRGTFDRDEVQHIVVFGGAGNDVIVINASLAIDATLFGEAGNDVIHGGAGSDGIDGGSGKDHLFGGRNDDTLCGNDGNDFLFGQQGNDLVGGDAGNDHVFGESGNDLVLGGDGNDFVFGGSGNDFVFGQAGNDRVFGDPGNDVVSGGAGNDRLFGSSGNDILIGGEGSDQLFGESGDDILVGGSTTIDEDIEALDAVLRELNARRSFAARINNIRTGGGATGGLALDEGSVFDDGDRDELWGGSGSDWFIVGPEDRIRDRSRNDRVN